MATQAPRPSFRLQTVNLDFTAAAAMADFYRRLLGWSAALRDDDFVLMRDPAGGTGPSFQQEAWYQPATWPERPGEPTIMIHLDIRVDDLDAAVAHVLVAGARLAEQQPRTDVRVMLDPAGHPFCLFLS